LVAFAGLVAPAITLCGCAHYHVEDRNAPAATFRFNYALGLSQYSVVLEDACEKGVRLAKLGAFDSSIKNVKIASGKSVRVKARTLFRDHPRGSYWCESVAEFTPQSGHAYRAWHYPQNQKCVLKVEDDSVKAAPPDLLIQDSLPCPPIHVSW
jgi:hypothetical protein